jgi:glycosyltransferase involved in cell wall biosynthesis
VRGGETGLLVPHGDVGALAGALRTLVGDPALRERLGRGARAFAETLPWSRAARDTATHLEEAVADWHRPEAR